MLRISPFAVVLLALPLFAQKYAGPLPPKPDMPYLVHADNLLPTEIATAQEKEHKKEITYIISGASSPVRTPLAFPIFLLQAEKLSPDRLQLYKLESKNGQREVLFSRNRNKSAQPVRLSVFPLGNHLYRIEADESVERGEYALTPEGSNQVFCFQVY